MGGIYIDCQQIVRIEIVIHLLLLADSGVESLFSISHLNEDLAVKTDLTP